MLFREPSFQDIKAGGQLMDLSAFSMIHATQERQEEQTRSLSNSVIMRQTDSERELARKYDLKSPSALLNRSDYSGKKTLEDSQLKLEYSKMLQKLGCDKKA